MYNLDVTAGGSVPDQFHFVAGELLPAGRRAHRDGFAVLNTLDADRVVGVHLDPDTAVLRRAGGRGFLRMKRRRHQLRHDQSPIHERHRDMPAQERKRRARAAGAPPAGARRWW